MTAEPTRLAYLDAMGLTAWTARYQLPNALATPVCDWPEQEAPQPVQARAGAESLHALLDDTAPKAAPNSEASPAAEASARSGRSQRKARALLGDIAPLEAEQEPGGNAAAGEVEAVPETAAESAEALRFECQVCCLDGRWLLMVAQSQPLDAECQRLLLNLLRAAGVQATQRPGFESLRWPLEEGLPVHQPLAEARQGLKAFVAGRRRRGWEPERVLLFGENEVLQSVVDAGDSDHSRSLALPLWQGPDLQELLGSAEAKRALWPRIQAWRQQWLGGAQQGD
ncbi:hypothetical protein [Halomonas cupida]|uniref:hypothetical protein n=1 Tax=Halomonas cupida TaxID=44933 RepID=UPI003A8E6B5B